MSLLLDEPPLVVLPSLAVKIGLNEAIILQQIHYWLQNKEKTNQDYHDGSYWVYNTYEQWQKQFPFWSVTTIRRTITKMENNDLLISGNYNRAGFDKTKWYTINYAAIKKMMESDCGSFCGTDCGSLCGTKPVPSVQNEQTMCSSCTDRTVQGEQTNTIDYHTTEYRKDFQFRTYRVQYRKQ